MRHNKYLYILVIQFKYDGMAWEDICEYHAHQHKQARKELREYRLSGGGQYRLIQRRVENVDNVPVMPTIEKTPKGYRLGNTKGVIIVQGDLWIFNRYGSLLSNGDCVTFAELSQRIVSNYDITHDDRANYAAKWLYARSHGIESSIYDVKLG